MDEKAARSLFCLVALCLSPTQEDADFLRSLGKILQVPEQAQAGAITMLNIVHEDDRDHDNEDKRDEKSDIQRNFRAAKRAEKWGAQVRASLPSKQFALEGFVVLMLLCLQGPYRLLQQDNQHPTIFNNSNSNNNSNKSSNKTKRIIFSKREAQELCRHVRFDAKTSVILRRLAFLLRIKLSTVAALEELAIFQIEQQISSSSVNGNNQDNNQEDDQAGRDQDNKKSKDRRKGVIRGLKIGGAAAAAGGLLAITGGLAAPALAVGLTHIGLGAAATFTTTASVAAFLGAGGAGLTGYKMSRRTKGCKHFEFRLINNNFSTATETNNSTGGEVEGQGEGDNRKGMVRKIYIILISTQA